MASTIDTDAYSNALVFLGTAGVVVPVVRRFGLSPILGYLGLLLACLLVIAFVPGISTALPRALGY